MSQKFKTLLIISLYVIISAFTFPPKTTWVAIGDSITYLNDHLNETGNRVTQGYMSLVVDKIPGLEYENQGHNGWTVVRIAKEIDKLNLKPADVYTVFLGTNDWWGSQTLGTMDDYKNSTGTSTVYGSYRIITDKLKNLNPKAAVILITPLKRLDFVYYNNMKNNAYGSYKTKNGKDLAEFANAVIEIGNFENYKVIDLYNSNDFNYKNIVNFKRLKDPQTGEYKNFKYPDFIDIPFNPETDEYPYPPEAINTTYDGLHPSDKGNKIIAKKIIKVIKPAIK
ncbi:SGNH/GDSL hydrolase family protein [Albibacterium bauzanense]|uniref:Lysophospholipase L1-like esterase n=1 Tax=Albibacterium bauzanense TaxID=653929 RepID=A0A4R1M1U7_9SPHI|nr:SGNH/GDSL hydrolase family protein [Albibacterium bauzanense]TCK83603.1 lysophospholipase L1-like esterase [Albibacterium bauzanense]